MRFACEILDDVLRELYPELLSSTNLVDTSRGETSELVGVLIEIERPRARLSRTETRGKPFTCLGELLWYLSRENSLDFISYYIPAYRKESEDNLTVHGGYGLRLFKHHGQDQVRNIIGLLRDHPSSRRAVIQIFDAEDISHHRREVPCTTTLQFILRDDRIHLLTTMRSNDAYMGLPHDVFCFTMLQEIVARALGCELGTYKHFVGSMHFYAHDRDDMRRYLNETVQPTIEMPPMLKGDPWSSIRRLLDAEDRIRNEETIDASSWGVEAYWADLIRLLQVFAATGDVERIDALKSAMTFKRYGPYIDSRKLMGARAPNMPAQPSLRL